MPNSDAGCQAGIVKHLHAHYVMTGPPSNKAHAAHFSQLDCEEHIRLLHPVCFDLAAVEWSKQRIARCT